MTELVEPMDDLIGPAWAQFKRDVVGLPNEMKAVEMGFDAGFRVGFAVAKAAAIEAMRPEIEREIVAWMERECLDPYVAAAITRGEYRSKP